MTRFTTGLDDVFVLATGDIEELTLGTVRDKVCGWIALKQFAKREKTMRNALISRAAVAYAGTHDLQGARSRNELKRRKILRSVLSCKKR